MTPSPERGTPRRQILVTGATGFIGRHLVTALAQAGFDLILAVRGPSPALPGAWQTHPRIRIEETGPLEDAPQLDAIMDSVSVVVHLAGLAHDPGASDARYDQANAVATERLVAAAQAAGVGSFIHMSSLGVVTDNESDVPIDDDTPARPATPYGRSKLAAERHVADFAQAGRFAISLRPPLVVGGDARGNWHSLQALAATGLPLPFGSVSNRRSLIDVEELVRALVLLCARDWPSQASDDYCLSNPQPLSLTEIVTELRAGMGIPARLFPVPTGLLRMGAGMVGKKRLAAGLLGSLRVDAGRFRQVFGLEPESDIKAAIRRSGAHYIAARKPA